MNTFIMMWNPAISNWNMDGFELSLCHFDEVEFNPNRSLGPISSCDVKVFSCSPESKECLPLIHGSHKT